MSCSSTHTWTKHYLVPVLKAFDSSGWPSCILGEVSCYGWAAHILPYLELAPLYNQLDVGDVTLDQNLLNANTRQALTQPMPAFLCPSDPGSGVNNYVSPSDRYHFPVSDGTNDHSLSKSNYVMVANAWDSTTPAVRPSQYGPAHGIGYANSNVKIRDVRDGTSNTLMVGERAYTYRSLNLVGAGVVMGFSPGNNLQSSSYGRKGNGLAVLGITYNGINAVVGGEHDVRGFSSNHVGGAQFVFADGSVHFLSENIDYRKGSVGNPSHVADINTTFQRLAVRDDGQPTGF